MLVKTYASAVYGVDAKTITVEVNVGGPLAPNTQSYYLVGLPDNAVKEGYQRLEAAINNVGIKFPRKKIIVNMAPADIRKEGSAFDLPIAIGILAASERMLSHKLHEFVLMGELSLDGSLRPIKGALPIAIQARKEGFKHLILPTSNAQEAAIVNQLNVYGVDNIMDAYPFWNNPIPIKQSKWIHVTSSCRTASSTNWISVM